MLAACKLTLLSMMHGLTAFVQAHCRIYPGRTWPSDTRAGCAAWLLHFDDLLSFFSLRCLGHSELACHGLRNSRHDHRRRQRCSRCIPILPCAVRRQGNVRARASSPSPAARSTANFRCKTLRDGMLRFVMQNRVYAGASQKIAMVIEVYVQALSPQLSPLPPLGRSRRARALRRH